MTNEATLELQSPRGLHVEESTETYGRFSAAPFERGWGVTVGNALRRMLIASIEGAAVTAIRFEGVQHELSTIPGVKEDTLDIILNISRVPLRVHGSEARTIRLQCRKPSVLTSGAIKTDPNVEILDPDVHIATMTEPGNLDIEMRVRNARGYVTSERNRERETGLDTAYIPVDSSHSPVRRVNFKVEPARVGQDTDFDRLILEIYTNGAVRPQEALGTAGRLLRDMLGIFVGGDDEDGDGIPVSDDQRAFDRYREVSIDEYQDQLSARAYNGLRNADIGTLGDLVLKSEQDLLRERNIGRKSIEEIQRLLEPLNLRLGMGGPD